MSQDHLELESLSAYLDGELNSRERSRAEQHLQTCAECSALRDRLNAVAGHVAALPAVQMTADEHRELRQRLLRAGAARAGAGRRLNLQWVLAGGLAVVAVTALSLGFLRPGSRGSDTLTEAFAPATENGAFNFSSGSEVDQRVASLPEVAAGVNRYRAEDAPEQSVGSALARESEEFADDSMSGALRGPAPPVPVPDRAGGPANGGTAGDQDSGFALPRHDAPVPEPAPGAAVFTNEAADACLARVAATQGYPMVPLLAREATFQGTPAWLLVFVWSPDPALGETLDRWQAWLVSPEDCRNLSGPELERRALYRSFSGPGSAR
ncbi:MAG TPA: zf-HC2 domain-containing protein [Actinomycetota bacterium]|nr:zf-HC2 domain-containing protein [Actinomycetota bacterium]